MGDVRLSKVSGFPWSVYVVDRDTGTTMGIVHRVERRYTVFVKARIAVEWDPVAWPVGSAPVPGASQESCGAAVAWIVEQHAEAAQPEPSVGPGDAIAAVYAGNLTMDSVIERCAEATGVYSADVDAILAWLIEQSGSTHICPVCRQDT